MAEQEKIYYPFRYLHHYVWTVAVYGSQPPLTVKGPLVLRTYYKDGARTIVDVKHTADYYIDEIFYETNKVIRENLGDPYSGRRDLRITDIPQLPEPYIAVYNAAEVPSPRLDDHLSILSSRDLKARGVAVILKKEEDGSVHYLTEEEAQDVSSLLRGN